MFAKSQRDLQMEVEGAEVKSADVRGDQGRSWERWDFNVYFTSAVARETVVPDVFGSILFQPQAQILG